MPPFVYHCTYRAMEKLIIAAQKYDPNSSSCLPLDAFNCKILRPSLFKDLIRTTFNLKFSPKELGAVIKYFDKENPNALPLDQFTGDVHCQTFVVAFLKLGKQKRREVELLQLTKNREAEEKYVYVHIIYV